MVSTHAPILAAGPATKSHVVLQSVIGVALVALILFYLGTILLRVEAHHHVLVAIALPFMGIAGILASLPFIFYIAFSSEFGVRKGPLFSFKDYVLIMKRVLIAVNQSDKGKVRSKDL
jgi:membrane-bound ClpP family serine protease